jgi:hypothetical protein
MNNSAISLTSPVTTYGGWNWRNTSPNAKASQDSQVTQPLLTVHQSVFTPRGREEYLSMTAGLPVRGTPTSQGNHRQPLTINTTNTPNGSPPASVSHVSLSVNTHNITPSHQNESDFEAPIAHYVSTSTRNSDSPNYGTIEEGQFSHYAPIVDTSPKWVLNTVRVGVFVTAACLLTAAYKANEFCVLQKAHQNEFSSISCEESSARTIRALLFTGIGTATLTLIATSKCFVRMANAASNCFTRMRG